MSILIEYPNLKLKPCPFCGKNSQYMGRDDTNVSYDGKDCKMYYVRCHHCGASVRALAPTYDEGVRLAQDSWRSRAK